jgi:hypothetical protein
MGGRGASSTQGQTKQGTVQLKMPSGLTKRQQSKIEYVYNIVLKDMYGSTSDNYDIKDFRVEKTPNATYVKVETGLKNDEGTYALFNRQSAVFVVGDKGALNHLDYKGNKKSTKYISQAFRDYEKK